jgi:flagellar biosynthesis/type III secretory pathway chaperone
MNTPAELLEILNEHLALCQELLLVVEREGQALRRSEPPSLFQFYQQKKNLLPRLKQSLDDLRKHRATWQKLNLMEKASQPEVGPLLRKNQDLTMKVIVLDRENEQALLRRGLVPPRELPSVNRQRPNFVTDLYRRGGPA